ncbi:MAG: ATP-dependent DNA helicase RecG [Patescibacteria group bacterium]|nr:ATP-dependent DNA helicase RecG [Patescibacteria group bacterium]
MRLTDSIETLPGVGKANAKKLHKLGIFNLSDLVRHFPYRYNDLSVITPIAETSVGGAYTVRAKVKSIKSRPGFRFRRGLARALIEDGTGALAVIWFNQPYLANTLKVGATYLFSGQISFYRSLQMQNPVWELDKRVTVHTGRIVPVYPLTSGIYPKWLRTLLKTALDSLPRFPETLPSGILKSRRLLSYDSALRSIHFPKSHKELQLARRRLSFDELLLHELAVLSHRLQLKKLPAPKIPFDQDLIKRFVSTLPFTLTKSQKLAAWQVLQDLESGHPANRLVAGDVGSGKTVVAAIPTLEILSHGWNVAFMAPTEILAEQHFRTFSALTLFSNLKLALLTASQAKLRKNKAEEKLTKKTLLEKLAATTGWALFGTHALIQKNIDFKDLGLVVVDEQHRFGVQQRAALQNRTREGTVPHFLSLTATPIPRTLALTLYGDLDVSAIPELPLGRKPVTTRIIEPGNRKTVYAEIEKELASGRQAFFICPLIDPSDKLGARSATGLYELLKTVFKSRRLGLLHGKLSSSEKTAVVSAFGEKKLDILVSTTVVEVGVDFPNATVMAIEGAERFGLAQLHQLRGRVGRSDMQSYCYLLPQNLGAKAKERLEALCQHHNGLELAEIDLKLRGPGETYGNLQSGYPQFELANIYDLELLQAAREEAQALLADDKSLRSPLFQDLIVRSRNKIHLE